MLHFSVWLRADNSGSFPLPFKQPIIYAFHLFLTTMLFSVPFLKASILLAFSGPIQSNEGSLKFDAGMQSFI